VSGMYGIYPSGYYNIGQHIYVKVPKDEWRKPPGWNHVLSETFEKRGTILIITEYRDSSRTCYKAQICDSIGEGYIAVYLRPNWIVPIQHQLTLFD